MIVDFVHLYTLLIGSQLQSVVPHKNKQVSSHLELRVAVEGARDGASVLALAMVGAVLVAFVVVVVVVVVVSAHMLGRNDTSSNSMQPPWQPLGLGLG